MTDEERVAAVCQWAEARLAGIAREQAKIISLGLMYGMGDAKLAAKLSETVGTSGQPTPRTVPDRLRDAAHLFEERDRAYGGNYRSMGAVMAAMYPGGLRIQTAAEWTRLMLQVHRVTKETRYACNFQRGGHPDSLEDLCVYAQMANETDFLASLGRPPEAQPSPPEDPSLLSETDEWATRATIQPHSQKGAPK